MLLLFFSAVIIGHCGNDLQCSSTGIWPLPSYDISIMLIELSFYKNGMIMMILMLMSVRHVTMQGYQCSFIFMFKEISESQPFLGTQRCK